MLRLLVGLLAVAAPCAALASPVVESIKGQASANGLPLFKGQFILAEANVITSPGSQLILRFDDGMQVAIGESSHFRIVDYRYTGGPNDRAVLDLLQGGARVSTGEIARTNPKQFFFRTPQAQFQTQGPADFSVVLVNPAYLTVNVGTVLASNGAGTVAFAAGSTATIASNAALATPIAASQMPVAATSGFGSLQTAALTSPGGAASGAALGAAAGTGLGAAGPLVFFGAAIAGAAGAFGGDDDDSTTTHH